MSAFTAFEPPISHSAFMAANQTYSSVSLNAVMSGSTAFGLPISPSL
ncbi:MAG TPA: hypothetical protein PLK02_08245 [Paludibacteraceae bacterium]|nr:hypothetical protein [Paludibacteraceae bacterium]